MSKIFCFSFQKTGTTSLHEFFIKAGFKSTHGLSVVDQVDYKKCLADAGQDLEKITDSIMPYLGLFGAFSDVPFGGLYRPIAERFPSAKFILITRNLDEWWQSLSSHWSLPLLDHTLTPMELVQYSPYLGFGKRTASQNDREAFLDVHRQHVFSVRNHLSNFDFLTFDLADADKTAKLAGFLNLQSPPPFPHSKPTNLGRVAKRLMKNLLRAG